MNRKELRTELERVLPWFKWSVAHQSDDGELNATGILASGYDAKQEFLVSKESDSEPYHIFWGGVSAEAKTFPRAVRLLQNQHEREASRHAEYASALEYGRKRK